MAQCLDSQLLGGILWLTENIIGNTAQNATTITGFTLIGIGAGAIVASHITSLIIPFKIANKYNENLKIRLVINLVSFELNFDIRINGFKLSFKKSFK
ncbi:P13 family porin [Borreliella garinii]|uniref:P13 family porin n=1 Tax=Borreliella garinii TaxID=29519 RepID=UPI0030134954